ncbi:hypothetical protein L3Y21_gp006 [Gordonia phage Rabbitrun]|uniref:Uncharacterized protein n=1 Tax=Gordonia phage Rabbitrun TaxID=2762280 RepID=A0A7G8LIH8_9CAUD|nr:hypothetical protein L3Y21_gp006 [Gordonia phage Rabbitrun]QNJ57050.1 hypothetical protein SEA_RABBITRUN_6 [Gordonia phage Rabbitrun]
MSGNKHIRAQAHHLFVAATTLELVGEQKLAKEVEAVAEKLREKADRYEGTKA